MHEGDDVTIRVDGREYASPDEMPPEIRRIYEEALAARRDAEPEDVDVEWQAGPGGTFTARTERSRLLVDGEEVDLEDLPPQMRDAVEEALESDAEAGGAHDATAGAGTASDVPEGATPDVTAGAAGTAEGPVEAPGDESHRVEIVREVSTGREQPPRREEGNPYPFKALLVVLVAILAALAIVARLT